jgi:hypothetical protein
MKLYTKEDLKGRLEEVSIFKKLREKRALGDLEGTKVIVANATRYIGQNCLTLFHLDPRPQNSDPYGDAITPSTSLNFKGLSPEEYIICGVYPTSLPHREFPRFSDIRKSFPVGYTSWAIYLMEGSTKGNGGRARMTYKNKIFEENKGLLTLVRDRLPKPAQSARLVVAETEGELEKIMDVIKKQGIIPIEMQPLKQ